MGKINFKTSRNCSLNLSSFGRREISFGYSNICCSKDNNNNLVCVPAKDCFKRMKQSNSQKTVQKLAYEWTKEKRAHQETRNALEFASKLLVISGIRPID